MGCSLPAPVLDYTVQLPRHWFVTFSCYTLLSSFQNKGQSEDAEFSSVAQSCPTLCDIVDCSTPGFPVNHQLPEFAQLLSIELVMPSNLLIFCSPLLLPPSIFPSIRNFSSESVLHIRWPKLQPSTPTSVGVSASASVLPMNIQD